jgi:hypothetical protein
MLCRFPLPLQEQPALRRIMADGGFVKQQITIAQNLLIICSYLFEIIAKLLE